MIKLLFSVVKRGVVGHFPGTSIIRRGKKIVDSSSSRFVHWQFVALSTCGNLLTEFG